ncbi:MAG: class I SAM-dependent methyltransferase [Candidatus Babeliales bacterium]
MTILTQGTTTNYTLLDTGNNQKLEQIGGATFIRPDSNCVWTPRNQALWGKAQKQYIGKDGWVDNGNQKNPPIFTYTLPTTQHSINAHIHFGTGKNIGVFPEQEANWSWMAQVLKRGPATPRVLNLFGYTGIASLVAAAAGAQVCHVDASKSAITWAKQNQDISDLKMAPIRWIVDDCGAFVARELKRKAQYDAIIMDPPAFGRDQKGKVFEFEKHIYQLLENCTQLLSKDPLFFIFNGYSMGYSATVLKNLMSDFYPKKSIDYGELHLQENGAQRTLPCSLYARWKGY